MPDNLSAPSDSDSSATFETHAVARPRWRAALAALARRPVVCTIAVALIVRLIVVIDAWQNNPLVLKPQLDGAYYLQWSSEIAAGDVMGRGGLVGGEPFFLNPLYAYVLAALLALGKPHGLLPPLLLNAVLGAAAAGLAAAAARRFGDLRAAWFAGLAVAFSTVLAHLDAHIAVSELAAFLIAGATFALAPPLARAVNGGNADRAGQSVEWGHGPIAVGLWLGIGALARPITPLVLPLAAWLLARRALPGKRLRAVVTVVVVFFACAVPSFTRNWTVAGEPALYTAAGGINLHLGNNALARTRRSMTSTHFRFTPTQMHDDALQYVEEAVGHEPTRDEISQFFVRMVIREITDHPFDSAIHYVNKARWFFLPAEIPSSASLAVDRKFQPMLPIAFLPTFVIAALAAGGLWLLRSRRDLLFAPGGLVLAHVAVLTAVFPLSHYRSPAVPAMAVIAGCGISAGCAMWVAGERRRLVAPVAITLLCAGAGAAPPVPDPLVLRDGSSLAIHYRDAGDFEKSEEWARWTIRQWLIQWPEDKEPAASWGLLGELRCRQKKFGEAVEFLTKAVALDPTDPEIRLNLSVAHEKEGFVSLALADAAEVVRRYPNYADGLQRLGELLEKEPGRQAEADRYLRRAEQLRGR